MEEDRRNCGRASRDNERDSISEWRPRLLRFRRSLMVAKVSSDSASAFQARLSSCLSLTWSCVGAISPLTLHAANMCQLLVSEFTVFTHSSLPSHALGAQFPSFICTALFQVLMFITALMWSSLHCDPSFKQSTRDVPMSLQLPLRIRWSALLVCIQTPSFAHGSNG